MLISKFILILATLSKIGTALNNGLGLTPPMGYSSWNDCASEVTEERIKNVTRALISTGLAAKGFVHVNVDEGWLLGRNTTTGEMIEDRKIARQNKDFKKADEIRDKLKKMNISIDDTTEGTKWIVND